MIVIVECGNATYRLAIFVERNPANGLATLEEVVALRVEDLLDIVIERSNPIRRISVDLPIEV